jgi:hypothetical protein
MRTTIRLPEELLKSAKRKAAAEGRTLTDLIEEGLRFVLAQRPRAAKKGLDPLPVSKNSGGLSPGVDLTRFADYQEMEDLEYIERLKRLK